MSAASQLSLADTIPVIKRCLCGASYSVETWAQLRFVGTQDDFDGGLIELRDCTCSSTIAIELPAGAPCR